ncbi:hypothetical protein DL770_006820 [Monosporascus sp. CRB-9-2]|nr:hypothetical protein DL770_006820 [Monosporascus sp. CRB-9-2]
MAEEENDGPPSERPSFTRFWKRVKQTASGDSLKFVPSSLQQQQQETQRPAGLGGGSKSDGEDGDRTATAKAQARRAQVRRAQIQHRQRKANYAKQLEMDAARLRDEIAQAEGERAALRGENGIIRRRLAIAGVPIPPALQQPQPQTATTMVGLPADTSGKASSPTTLTSGSASTMSTLPSSVQYIVSLDMSEMNSPAYQVYRTSTTSSSEAGGSAGTPNDPGAAATSDDVFNLTDAQTDYAINFILALEHVCWDHFHPSYFSYAHYDEAAEENTHMLMASALALQSAPASVFDQMAEVREHLQANPSRAVYPPSSSHPHSQTQTQHEHQHTHQQQQQQQQKPPPPPIPSPISWRQRPGPAAAGLSLGSLRRLAEVLSPPDVELAPVQAWFEIARACGPTAVRDAALMDFLKRELASVVRCVHFGAAIPRHAFDEVIYRGRLGYEASSSVTWLRPRPFVRLSSRQPVVPFSEARARAFSAPSKKYAGCTVTRPTTACDAMRPSNPANSASSRAAKPPTPNPLAAAIMAYRPRTERHTSEMPSTATSALNPGAGQRAADAQREQLHRQARRHQRPADHPLPRRQVQVAGQERRRQPRRLQHKAQPVHYQQLLVVRRVDQRVLRPEHRHGLGDCYVDPALFISSVPKLTS